MSQIGNYTKAPLSRIINETRHVGFCKKCGSSLVRKYLLFFWVKPFCINDKCDNHKKSKL